MTLAWKISVLTILAAASLGAAPATDPSNLPEPDVRVVYESDTRAYYRPCG